MKQEHTNMKHTSIKKKNSIVNCIVIKSCVKACKDTKNIMKKSSDEKTKCVCLTKKKLYHQLNYQYWIDCEINK